MHTISHVETDQALNRPRNNIHKRTDVVMCPGGDPIVSGVSAILVRRGTKPSEHTHMDHETGFIEAFVLPDRQQDVETN